MVEDFGGVAFGFNGGPDGFDFAGFADEERAADDAHEFASHELLLLPGAIGFDGLVVGIAEQRKIEFVFGFEDGLGFDRVGAHAEDGHFELVELLFCVAKLGRFDDSTRSAGFGEKKEEDALALEVLERDGFVFVGLQTERGGFVGGLEHGDEVADSLAEIVRAQVLPALRGPYRSHGENAIEYLEFEERRRGWNAKSAERRRSLREQRAKAGPGARSTRSMFPPPIDRLDGVQSQRRGVCPPLGN